MCCRGRRVRAFTSLSNFTVPPVAVGPAQVRTSTAAVRGHLEPEVEQRWRPARCVFFPRGRLLAALVGRARPGVSDSCDSEGACWRAQAATRRDASEERQEGPERAERKQAEELQPHIRHIWRLLLK